MVHTMLSKYQFPDLIASILSDKLEVFKTTVCINVIKPYAVLRCVELTNKRCECGGEDG